MKLFASAVLALSALTPVLALSNNDNTNIATCRKANPDILKAIDAFCNKPGGDTMMIPSAYAKAGKTVGRTHVSVKGDCKPAQWLPKKYCLSQFHEICGFGGGFGGGYGRTDVGRGNCQMFLIEQNKK